MPNSSKNVCCAYQCRHIIQLLTLLKEIVMNYEGIRIPYSLEPITLESIVIAFLLSPHSPSVRDSLAGPAVRLLNQNDDLLSTPQTAIKILRAIPDHWSVTLIAPFLARSVRSSLHAKRTAAIGKNLASTLRDDRRTELLRLKRESAVKLTAETRSCPVCGDYLLPSEAGTIDDGGDDASSSTSKHRSKIELHRYPNGVVTHAGCGSRDRKTCPVTGRVFS